MRSGDTLWLKWVRYTFVRVIDDAGNCEVWEAQSKGRRYAIKVLRPTDADAIAHFERELSLCKQANQPGVIRVLADGWTVEGLRCCVMPFFPDTLKSVIDKGAKVATMMNYLLQLSEAVYFLYEAGVAHRNLKPENILIDNDTLVIADFSLATFRDQPPMKMSRFSTPRDWSAYLERARATFDSAGHAADVHALGLIIRECLAGPVPMGAHYRTIRGTLPTVAELDSLVERIISSDKRSHPNAYSVMSKIRYLVSIGASGTDEGPSEVSGDDQICQVWQLKARDLQSSMIGLTVMWEQDVYSGEVVTFGGVLHSVHPWISRDSEGLHEWAYVVIKAGTSSESPHDRYPVRLYCEDGAFQVDLDKGEDQEIFLHGLGRR